MSRIARMLDVTVDGATLVAALAVALMMLHIAVDVAIKMVFSTPLPGTIAIVSNYYMVAVVFIPLAFAEKRDAHISVEIVTDHFPRSVRRWLEAASRIFSVGVYGLLVMRGFMEAERKRDVGTFIVEQGHRIDTWPAYYLLPLGAGLMALVLAWKLVCSFRGETAPDPMACP